MKKSMLLFVVLIFAANLFSNGLSLNSIGSKALGMGGAFVGLADDPTAIHWNPAGLIGQKSGISLFMTDVIPFAKFKNETSGIEAETKTNNYISPNLFFNYSMDKFAFGLGAYVPAGLGAEWDGADLKIYNEDPNAEFEWMSKIAVFNISPSVAYNFYKKFNFGVAANIYYGMMEMKRPEDMLNPADPRMDIQTAFDIKGLGYGATVSLKWECLFTEKLDIGFTYKTPVNVKFEGDANMGQTYNADLDIEWPAWFGFGFAFQPCAMTTFTLDAQYTNWKKLEMLVANIHDVPNMPNPYEKEIHLDWADAVQIRFGMEKKFNDSFAARLGYYYDPAPAPDETLNILFPSSTNHVITTGCGWQKNKLNVDFGLEYLFGGERDIEQAVHNMGGIHQMNIFAFSLGLGFMF